MDAPAQAPQTLQALVRGLGRRGDARALIAVGETDIDAWSYAELAGLVDRLAGGLRARGVGPGDAVAIFAPNRPEWVFVRLALVAVGALAVPIDDLLDGEPLAHVVRDSGCSLIFTTGRLVETLRAAGCADGLEPVLLDGGDWRALLDAPPDEPVEADPETPVALFYTSGTTGPPKGVPLTHRNILSNLQAVLDQRLIGGDDRVLVPLPFHHSYPFIVGMLLPLASGAAIVLPADVSGAQIVRALGAAEATAMVGVPRLFEALAAGIERRVAARGRAALGLYRALVRASAGVRERFGVNLGRVVFRRLHARLAPRLRIVACGGARIEPEIERALIGLGWDVASGYGLVETASISTFNPPGRGRVGSVGLPVGDIAARIDDSGEVLLRGPSVFAGYRNDPEANAAAFTDDGWFRTGDLGHLDADGYLYITGRAKEMIVLPDGKNVAPETVEAVYAESPYLREVAVLERRGDLVALVVPDVDAVRAKGTTHVDSLVRVALAEQSQRLPRYQRVAGYAIAREPLPRTRLGKYRRHELAAIYERALRGERPDVAAKRSEDDEALLRGPRARRVWAWLEERFPEARLDLDTNPQLDLGVDSLAWVGLGLEMEERTGVRLSEATLGEVVTLRDLLRAAEAAEDADAGERSPALDRRWLEPPGPALAGLGWGLYWLNRGLMRALFRVESHGAERLPGNAAPLLVACNHASDLDPLAIAAALPWRQMRRSHWGGDAGRLFATPARRLLCRAARVFPVDDRTPGTSLAYGVEALRRGDLLIWFPEEWRSPDGALQPFLSGVGRLINEAAPAVVPAYIRGSFAAMPRGRRLPRPAPISVVFGTPLAAADVGDGDEAAVAAALRDKVAALAEAGTAAP